MESNRPQLVADIAENQKPPAITLNPEQLKALAGVTRPQLLEDLVSGISTPGDLEDESF